MRKKYKEFSLADFVTEKYKVEDKQGREVRITKVNDLSSAYPVIGCVDGNIMSYTKDGKFCADKPTDSDLFLYTYEYEKGDYIHLQCGDLLIINGVEHGRYCFDVAMSDGKIIFPDEFYTWGNVLPEDRLATDEERKTLDKALALLGHKYDKTRGLVEYDRQKMNTFLFFLEECDVEELMEIADKCMELLSKK